MLLIDRRNEADGFLRAGRPDLALRELRLSVDELRARRKGRLSLAQVLDLAAIEKALKDEIADLEQKVKS